MLVELPVEGAPKPVLVDAEVVSKLEGATWFFDSSTGYVRGYIHGQGRGGSGRRYLHRVIVGTGFGDRRQVDHINRDRLDNRRRNLRVVTHAENCQNRGSYVGGTSPYRGVWRARSGWVAKASLDNKTCYIGTYENEYDAAAAAAQWRVENHPGTVEEQALLAHKIGPKRDRRISTPIEIFAVHLARVSTSLSYGEVGELLALPRMTATNIGLRRTRPRFLAELACLLKGEALDNLISEEP